MEYFVLLIAFILFLLSLYFVIGRPNRPFIKNKLNRDLLKKDNDKFSKSGENESVNKQVKRLTEKITDLQKFIGELKIKTRNLEKINIELENDKNKLLKQLERIELLQKRKDELFEIFLHDIKNPVGVIKNLTELLNAYDITMEEQKEIVQILFITSEKIIKLANDISRSIVYESSEFDFDFSVSNISDIILETYRFNLMKARRKEIEIKIDIDKNIPEIKMDPLRVSEVIDNLIDNAIKYSENGKKIYISAYTDNNIIIVEVKDEGPGLTEQEMKIAFNKGVRLSAKPTGDEMSSGLGLWIVKTIVEKHSGNIWINSKPGKGSVFSFCLPIR